MILRLGNPKTSALQRSIFGRSRPSVRRRGGCSARRGQAKAAGVSRLRRTGGSWVSSPFRRKGGAKANAREARRGMALEYYDAPDNPDARNMQMTKLAIAALLMALLTSAAHAQTNAGEQKSDPNLPFNIAKVATFDLPWRIAFLPDGRMLVTEKVGRVDLVTPQGAKTEIGGVPPSYVEGQDGMLGVFLSPHYATDHNVYLAYVEPGDYGGGVALGRGRLVLDGKQPRLEGFKV